MGRHRVFDRKRSGKPYMTIGRNCVIWHNLSVRLNGIPLDGVTATHYGPQTEWHIENDRPAL